MKPRPLALVKHHGPTLLVLLSLLAIGYWGHRTGWKAPKFSALFGEDSAEEVEDWCEAHSVPESKCVACRPELGGADPQDWCKEHGVPESRCTICHPEILAQGEALDWCRGHGVPESQCTICHPEIAIKGDAPKGDAPATVVLAPAAGPAKIPFACQTHALRVQFASPGAVHKAGVKLEAVKERPMARRVSADAGVEYDQTRVARLSPRSSGIVWRVEKNLGDEVKKGDVLALIDAVEVGRAKAELLQAIALIDVKSRILERIQESAESGFRTRGELQEAEAALREARVRLFNAHQALINLGLTLRIQDIEKLPAAELARSIRLVGLPEPITKTLDPDLVTANLIPLTSPLDGFVVFREAVAGEVVGPSSVLFVVADTNRVWVKADVRLEDAPRLRLGQKIVFRPDGSPDDCVTGNISWISTAADKTTRTVAARAAVANPEGKLRADTFGKAQIIIRETPNAVAVPDEAVHWEGCCNIVFVRVTDGIFQTRKIRTGTRSGGFSEVLVGLVPGEVIATAGSHVLKSEILRSSLGAGCAGD